MASDYRIKIRQEIDHRLQQDCSWIPYDCFHIRLEFHHISPLNSGIVDETQSVIYPRDVLLSEERGENILLSLFANTGLPLEFLQTVIVPDVLFFAWEIDADPVNLGRKIIKLLVEVIVWEIDDQVTDQSLGRLNFKPASMSSIQALKRVKLGDDQDRFLPLKKRRLEGLTSTSKKECSICLDEFWDGEEVALMPCGHVYHDACVVRWLKTSHLCPLCRYEMPS